MEQTLKKFPISLKSVDPYADISLINRYSQTELTPEGVFCFSVILCDNEVDRDMERFPAKTLEALAPMFVGKTGISDHDWSARRQVARLYRVETETTAEVNSFGEALVRLMGSAYMVRNNYTESMIQAIEGGIMKEVSVGVSIGRTACSICGAEMDFSFDRWERVCENGHMKGQEYDGRMCVEELLDPTDAYEFSFVAVPSQRGAGVTKSKEDIKSAFLTLLNADLRDYQSDAMKLLPKIRAAMMAAEESAERTKILEENKKYMKEK